MTAVFLLYHSFCRSEAHSIITIIVSIAIQRVRTSEKFVKKFREIPMILSTANVIKNESGRSILVISDSLKPTKRNMTTKTNTRV